MKLNKNADLDTLKLQLQLLKDTNETITEEYNKKKEEVVQDIIKWSARIMELEDADKQRNNR